MKKLSLLLFVIVISISSFAQSNFDDYIKKARKGDAEAQNKVGNCYYTGDGAIKDYNQAFSWYMKAAEQGYPNAQHNLGNCYLSGNGAPKDTVVAFSWYMKAAEQGFAKSEFNVANCYEFGCGVAQNYSMAAYWYKRAADKGNSNAQFYLANLYLKGLGVAQDYTQAFEWFLKSAKQGDVIAMNNVGNLYFQGNGVTQNNEQGFFWYKKAADAGNLFAQRMLGYCYLTGSGVTQSQEQAIFWYKKAAEQGDDYSQLYLGQVYYNINNYEQSFFWIKKSAENGNVEAQSILGSYYFHGNVTQQNYTLAVYWYKKAAEQGFADAQFALGYCYYEGLSVAQDLKKAYTLYKKAAAQGHEMAINNLVILEDYLKQNNIAYEDTKTSKQEEKQVTQPKKNITSSIVDRNIPSESVINTNTFAVIIGNEKYQNEVEVPFAENDANTFKEYAMKTLGVPEKQIRYVANGTLNSIRMAVRWLSQAMEVSGGDGQIIFYYAGHGIPDESNKSAYLLPVDGMGSDPESAFPLDRLYSELGKMPAQRITVFLDACFSGSKREGGMLASARGVAIKAKQAAPQGNMIVFTAAQGDETAYPYKDQGHGMFTYYLLKKLQETKGNVTLGDLADYIQKEVKRQSFVENNKMQTPSVVASSSLGEVWKNLKIK